MIPLALACRSWSIPAGSSRGEVIPLPTTRGVTSGARGPNGDRGDLLRAATSEWGLRSADAMHLATALRIEADELVTYDAELAAAAERTGLRVNAPGATDSPGEAPPGSR